MDERPKETDAYDHATGETLKVEIVEVHGHEPDRSAKRGHDHLTRGRRPRARGLYRDNRAAALQALLSGGIRGLGDLLLRRLKDRARLP